MRVPLPQCGTGLWHCRQLRMPCRRLVVVCIGLELEHVLWWRYGIMQVLPSVAPSCCIGTDVFGTWLGMCFIFLSRGCSSRSATWGGPLLCGMILLLCGFSCRLFLFKSEAVVCCVCRLELFNPLRWCGRMWMDFSSDRCLQLWLCCKTGCKRTTLCLCWFHSAKRCQRGMLTTFAFVIG